MNPADAFRTFWEKSFHRGIELRMIQPLGGGSINQVYKADTAEGSFVMKVNSITRFPGMFSAEAKGLALLSKANGPAVPEVYAETVSGNAQFLLMEYLEPGKRIKDFFGDFGRRVAELHRNSSDSFGLDHTNYMGSLPQYNEQQNNIVDFYIKQRLEPQVKMATDNGNLNNQDVQKFEALYASFSQILPQEPPSLIHGDLWNGNYIVGPSGTACIIDPAVAYSAREADLAMTKLFGGFDEDFYAAYYEEFPLQQGWLERIDLWNLYPLLVHVNLFGGGYVEEVRRVLKKYLH